jgi:hypothetical protein
METTNESLDSIRNINNVFVDKITELHEIIKTNIKKTNKEHKEKILRIKLNLIEEICKGENLNLEEIKMKYLKDTSKQNKNYFVSHNDEDILDTIEINKKQYYYENKEKGNIYDKGKKIVGSFRGGLHIIY